MGAERPCVHPARNGYEHGGGGDEPGHRRWPRRRDARGRERQRREDARRTARLGCLRSARGVGDGSRFQPRGWCDSSGAQSDAGDDASQFRELGLTAGTRRQVRFERPGFGRIERVDGVRRDGVFEFFVGHHPIAFRSAIIALRIRVLIVPSGTPVRAAISECVRPS